VTAQGIGGGARLQGFRIAGDAQTPLQVGVRLADSDVEVEGVEITGALTAGIDVAGADRSQVHASFVHDNPGGGVLIEDGAAPRLLNNLIAGNGRAAGAPPHAGVEVRGAARPDLVDNRFEGNGGGGIQLPAAERADELFAWNSFAGVARADAVRVAAPAGQTPPAAPARPRRRSP
jgi:hypothetical protein